jgi:hypothetical protein
MVAHLQIKFCSLYCTMVNMKVELLNFCKRFSRFDWYKGRDTENQKKHKIQVIKPAKYLWAYKRSEFA